jgi:hypothetical protein
MNIMSFGYHHLAELLGLMAPMKFWLGGVLLCILFFYFTIWKRQKLFGGNTKPLDFSKIQPLTDFDHKKTLPTPYRPWKAGRYNMTMGIRKLPEDEWLVIDNLYEQEQQLRRHLLSTDRQGVMQCLPGAEKACEEALEYIANFLIHRYPSQFKLLKDPPGCVYNGITNRTFKVVKPYEQHPLEVAAQLCMEDINLLLQGVGKEERDYCL